ncbi:hypothetical protein P7K49_011385 [Saguinus oedipus]|uniref:KIND domain-containing protein n=1 Tax=Saguinus oedipus TaxID=9490 RepID=A0ABQ9VRX6_SAGOE|nr:hypothetical protein P7K49_011385 [Saguinus oedipus]
MELAAGSFSEEQFREACAELQQPALAGADWQLLVETSGISIYRLLDQGLECDGVDLPAGRAGLLQRREELRPGPGSGSRASAGAVPPKELESSEFSLSS